MVQAAPSLPFTCHTAGVQPLLLSSPRPVLTLTSRHCPGPYWGFCVEHDVIVLRRAEGRASGSCDASWLDFWASHLSLLATLHPASFPRQLASPARLATPDLQQLLEPASSPVPQVEEAVSRVVAMQGLLHPAVRVWTFLAETQMGEGQLETVGGLVSQEPLREGCGGQGRWRHWRVWSKQKGREDRERRFTPTILPLPRALPQQPLPPSCCPFRPHPLGLHSWHKRHCSSHCRTGGGTGCSESACSLLGPVRTRTCTWGSLQGTAGQGWDCHCTSGPQEESCWQGEIYRANRQPHLCHFPEGTSPSPGPGTPGHWCVSSSGNLHSSGLGAAPPTAGRKDASHKSAIPGPSCWSLHSDPVLPGLVHGTAFHHLLKSQTKGPALALISTPHPFTIKSVCHPSLAQPCPLFFIRTMTTLL